MGKHAFAATIRAAVRFTLPVLLMGLWTFGAVADIWYVDVSVSASGDGQSWAAAKKTISEATGVAAAGDEIWVADGIYLEGVVLPDGVSLYGGFVGGEAARELRDPSVNFALIVGGDLADHGVTVSGTANIRLDGFVIRDGNADGSGDAGRGGGLFSSGASDSVVIAHCRFTQNSAQGASGQGGGAYVVNGSPRFESCTFDDNSSGSLGGGFHCTNASPTLNSCTFFGNRAPSGGGGLYCYGSNVTVEDCTFESNSSDAMGGGLQVRWSALHATESLFLGNSAPEGGGVMGFNADPLLMERCTFVGNTASTYGGGFGGYSSVSTLRDCTFTGNYAGSRGGAGVESHEGPMLTLVNCRIVGNRTGSSGGAILGSWQPVTVINCTIADNAAAIVGGGIHCDYPGTITALNTHFAYNENLALYVAPESSLTSLDHCFFGGNYNGDVFTGSMSAVATGAAAIENALPQADGTVDGNPGFEFGTVGTLTASGNYNLFNHRTTLFDDSAAFVPDALMGSLLRIEGAPGSYTLVTGNTEHALTVVGDLSAWAAEGAVYRLLDYRLGADSDAVDMGVLSGASDTDFEGDPRGFNVAGTGIDGLGLFVDIGADERIDPDSDGDGLADGIEALYGTNPAAQDTDGDGFTDSGEIHVTFSDPLKVDTDGDWFTDFEEWMAGTDLHAPESRPWMVGDLDHSGWLNAMDVQMVINGALGKATLFRTDVDLSGGTNAMDVQIVINAVLHSGGV